MSGSSWDLPSIQCWRHANLPPLLLTATADPPPRLGWNTWIPGPAGGLARRNDAADAIFEAEVIEAQQVDWRRTERAA